MWADLEAYIQEGLQNAEGGPVAGAEATAGSADVGAATSPKNLCAAGVEITRPPGTMLGHGTVTRLRVPAVGILQLVPKDAILGVANL